MHQLHGAIFNHRYTIYSSERYLYEEIKYIEPTLEKVNNYPKYVINQLNRDAKLKQTGNMNIECSTINEAVLNKQDKRHFLVLPYAGNKGEKILKSMNNFSSEVLPCNVRVRIAYSGTKFSSRFQLIDQTKKDHQHDMVYYGKCPNEQCTEDYTGEAERGPIEHVKNLGGEDVRSHLFEDSVGKKHKTVKSDDFKIIEKSYKRSKSRRKLAESLNINENRSSLITQDAFVPLKLFN